MNDKKRTDIYTHTRANRYNEGLTLDLHPAAAHHPKMFAKVSTMLEKKKKETKTHQECETETENKNVSKAQTQM